MCRKNVETIYDKKKTANSSQQEHVETHFPSKYAAFVA